MRAEWIGGPAMWHTHLHARVDLARVGTRGAAQCEETTPRDVTSTPSVHKKNGKDELRRQWSTPRRAFFQSTRVIPTSIEFRMLTHIRLTRQ